jgi:hypothetical protein
VGAALVWAWHSTGLSCHCLFAGAATDGPVIPQLLSVTSQTRSLAQAPAAPNATAPHQPRHISEHAYTAELCDSYAIPTQQCHTVTPLLCGSVPALLPLHQCHQRPTNQTAAICAPDIESQTSSQPQGRPPSRTRSASRGSSKPTSSQPPSSHPQSSQDGEQPAAEQPAALCERLAYQGRGRPPHSVECIRYI